MFGDLPLHPVVVHFPLAMVALLPVMTIVFFVLIKRKVFPKIVWWVVVALQIVSLGSSILSEELGEEDEEKIEDVVDEAILEAHEEWGERFVKSQVVTTVAAAVTTVPMTWPWSPVVYLALQAASGYAAFEAGHSGGELVYKGGAGSAFK